MSAIVLMMMSRYVDSVLIWSSLLGMVIVVLLDICVSSIVLESRMMVDVMMLVMRMIGWCASVRCGMVSVAMVHIVGLLSAVVSGSIWSRVDISCVVFLVG